MNYSSDNFGALFSKIHSLVTNVHGLSEETFTDLTTTIASVERTGGRGITCMDQNTQELPLHMIINVFSVSAEESLIKN